MVSLLDIGLGRVGSNSHPIHPSTVHLPIAFLLSASALDIVSYTGSKSPAFLSLLSGISNTFFADTKPAAVLYFAGVFGFAATLAGIVTAMPALSSGLFEGYAMISAQGLDLSNPKHKATIVHAALNDVAVIGAVYNLLSKWNRDAFLPTGVNTLISATMLGGVIYSAYLGGGLVYEHGVGVQRMGKGKEIKDSMIEEEKSKARKEL